MKRVALREILLLLKRASWKSIPARIIETLECIHLGELKTRIERDNEEKKKTHVLGKKRRRNERIEKEEKKKAEPEKPAPPVDLIQLITSIYFRIIKFLPQTHLIGPVLTGVRKFATYLNLEIIWDLIKSIT